MVFYETKRRIFLSIVEASVADGGEECPPSHAYGLATALDLNRSTTGRHLRSLAEDDLIEPASSSGPRTEYQITDAGASIVDIIQNTTDIFLGETKRDILESIAETDSIHGYALASALSLQKSNVYHHLSELESNGLIRAEQDGRNKNYELTNSGSTLAGILCV